MNLLNIRTYKEDVLQQIVIWIWIVQMIVYLESLSILIKICTNNIISLIKIGMFFFYCQHFSYYKNYTSGTHAKVAINGAWMITINMYTKWNENTNKTQHDHTHSSIEECEMNLVFYYHTKNTHVHKLLSTKWKLKINIFCIYRNEYNYNMHTK